jgi:hypothetical protein
MWVYIQSETFSGEHLSLWTVGYHHPVTGEWRPESDHGEREDAAARVHYLNGGCDGCRMEASRG